MVLTFLYMLSGGMAVVLAAGDVGTIAWKFLRTAGVMMLALIAGATVWVLRDAGWRVSGVGSWLGVVALVGAACLVLAAPVLERSPAAFRLLTLLAGAAGIAAGGVHGRLLTGEAPSTPGVDAMILASFVLSALLLGSLNVSWLLGHAYLTQTKMTIAPLRRFSGLLLFAVGMRIGFAVLSFVLIGTGAASAVSVHMPEKIAGAWLMLTLRVGVGLFLVGLFAAMEWQCVRLRSTQSATGILYFAMVLACIGEFASLELLSELGWPV